MGVVVAINRKKGSQKKKEKIFKKNGKKYVGGKTGKTVFA